MTTKKPFKPYHGSVAWKVIAFLRAHPEARLTKGEISKKFGPQKVTHVDECLEPAVKRGALVRSKAADGRVYWSLGDATDVVLSDAPWKGSKGATAHKQEVPPDPPLHDPFARAPAAPKVKAIPIKRGQRAPVPKDAAGIFAWLKKFEVGDTAEFGPAIAPRIKVCVLREGARVGRFRLVHLSPVLVRLERLA